MNERFDYQYSAAQKKVGVPEKESENRRALIAAIGIGLAGTLLFGLGLCCLMLWNLWISGILLGLIGLAGVAAALPVYNRISETQAEVPKGTNEKVQRST